MNVGILIIVSSLVIFHDVNRRRNTAIPLDLLLSFVVALVAIGRPLPLHGSNKVDFVIRRLFVAVISVDGGHAHPREYHDDDYGNCCNFSYPVVSRFVGAICEICDFERFINKSQFFGALAVYQKLSLHRNFYPLLHLERTPCHVIRDLFPSDFTLKLF